MGILFNKFTTLVEAKMAKLDQYLITTLVIHDPADEEFKKLVRNEYEDLCMRTGNKHLFVSFISPESERWNRPSYEPESGIKSLAFEKGMDNEVVLSLLCTSLGLKEVAPPFLLVTNSLASNRFYIIPTSTKQFREQMMSITMIGEMCSDTRLNIDSPEFEKSMSRLSPAAEYKKIYRSIRDVLLEMTAPQYAKSNDRMIRDSAMKLIRRSDYYKKNASPIQYERSPRYNDDPYIVFHRLPSSIDSNNLSMGMIVTSDRERVDYAFVDEEESDEEKLSKRVNQSAYQCLIEGDLELKDERFWNIKYQYWNLLETETRRNVLLYDMLCKMSKELSVFVIAKAIETELYLSVLQMMRHCIGISMPEYYKRPELSGNQWVFKRNTFTADLNEYDVNRRLKPMALGKMKSVYDQMKHSVINKEGLVSEHLFVTIGDSDNFERRDLNELAIYRNQVLHYQPGFDLTDKIYQKIINDYNSIMDKYMEEMIALKVKLRGDDANQVKVG